MHRWFKVFNKEVQPIGNEKMKYFRLVERIRKGELFQKEDIEFLKTLSSDKLIVILKLYNIQHFNLYREANTYPHSFFRRG